MAGTRERQIVTPPCVVYTHLQHAEQLLYVGSLGFQQLIHNMSADGRITERESKRDQIKRSVFSEKERCTAL